MLLSSTTFAQRYERSPCNAPSALVPSRTAVAVVRSRKAAASTTSGNDRHGVTSSTAASSTTSYSLQYGRKSGTAG